MPRSKKSDPQTYTKPELRDKIKAEVLAGDKGGNPGQWSARKAQIVAHEYETAGGGYKKPRNESQQSLKQWEDEKWTTADGKRARRSGGTTRYLPEKAWNKLSAGEKAATNKKKTEGSKEGKQFVSNTKAAATARKTVTKNASAKKVVAKKRPAAKKRAVKRAAKKRRA